jgi:hypothetical protein
MADEAKKKPSATLPTGDAKLLHVTFRCFVLRRRNLTPPPAVESIDDNKYKNTSTSFQPPSFKQPHVFPFPSSPPNSG